MHLTPFFFDAATIRYHGKRMGIPLPENVWLRVKFAFHRHAVIMSRREYDATKVGWAQNKNMDLRVQLAFVGQAQCLLLTDLTKWYWNFTRYGYLAFQLHIPKYVYSSRLPEPRDYRSFVRRHQTVFRSGSIGWVPENVPARSTAINTFDFSDGITRYYNSCFIKVYKRKKAWVKIDHYERLLRLGLIHPERAEGEVEGRSGGNTDIHSNASFDVIVPSLSMEERAEYQYYNHSVRRRLRSRGDLLRARSYKKLLYP